MCPVVRHTSSQSLSHAVCPQLSSAHTRTRSPHRLLSPLLLTFTADCIITQQRCDDANCANRPAVLYAKSSTVWEPRAEHAARFMQNSLLGYIAGYAKLNCQILCCTIVAFLSPKGNVLSPVVCRRGTFSLLIDGVLCWLSKYKYS